MCDVTSLSIHLGEDASVSAFFRLCLRRVGCQRGVESSVFVCAPVHSWLGQSETETHAALKSVSVLRFCLGVRALARFTRWAIVGRSHAWSVLGRIHA